MSRRGKAHARRRREREILADVTRKLLGEDDHRDWAREYVYKPLSKPGPGRVYMSEIATWPTAQNTPDAVDATLEDILKNSSPGMKLFVDTQARNT